MSRPPRAQPQSNPDDEPVDDGAASFDWEFRNDDYGGQPPTALPRSVGAPYLRQRDSGAEKPRAASPDDDTRYVARGRTKPARPHAPGKWVAQPVRDDAGRFGLARANYVRDQLDQALDLWWAAGELPPLLLLRDGLLLLEAGGSVSESQRTLLLRAAVAYDKGVQTALRHQADAERVAMVLAEAVVEWEVPLAAERLPELLRDRTVQHLLVAELERSRILLTGEGRRRAQAALEVLPPLQQTGADSAPPLMPNVTPTVASSMMPRIVPVFRSRRPFRQILLILLLVALVGFVWWRRQQLTPSNMVAMPAATYALLTEAGDGAAQSVRLDAFLIDRLEVTNHEYRQCLEAGACIWPVEPNGATRPDYFTNPAFEGYPVVNVTHGMAADFCEWREKRLPTAAEWQSAASISPTTGQPFRYPWGEAFEAQRANGGGSQVVDTMVVGSFRPSGDSPSGVADMAGNVAEWTATLVDDGQTATRAIVKGGSFRSDAASMLVGAWTEMDVAQASSEVGFRCARTHLLTQSN